MHIPRNETELKLYRQTVIREYKQKHPQKPFQKKVNKVLDRFRHIIPVNIGLGIAASVLYIIHEGFLAYYIQLLTATIWITIVGTMIGVFFTKR